MSSLSRRFAVLPTALLIVVLAGCGASSHSATRVASPAPLITQGATPVATSAVPATPVIRGGSTAAVVNGHRVPMATYRTLLVLLQRQSAQSQGTGQPPPSVATLAQRAMEQVLAQEILRQYAVSHGITVTSGQINAQIQSDTRQLGGTAALHAQMAQVGLTMASYRSLLEANLLGRAVEARVTPLQKKPQPDAHVRHILIALQPQGKAPRTDAQAHALAQQVLARVQRGANFAALARKDSDDPGSATKGGDLGNIYRGQTVKPFEQAAFTLPLNRPALVHTVFGYHIVEVLARGSSVMPLQYQQQQQNQAFNTWLTGRLKAAKIQRIAALAPQG